MREIPKMLSMKECQIMLGISRASAYRLLTNEPGVHRILIPGSDRPIIRVEATVIDRILQRSAIHA